MVFRGLAVLKEVVRNQVGVSFWGDGKGITDRIVAYRYKQRGNFDQIDGAAILLSAVICSLTISWGKLPKRVIHSLLK